MQEARGTSRALREGVTQLRVGPEVPSVRPPPVESMLDALDGAIELMSELESQPGHAKGRRGRIDVASLLFEIAPDARIAVEPGAGTEVQGVESDLRRMLSVLVGVGTGGPATHIRVRRENDIVHISAELGPDSSGARDLEHRWLHRMAVRHAGRVELELNRQILSLPADVPSEQRELQQLRKELEQAQELGAVYAKELAEAFTVGGHPSSVPPPSQPPSNSDRLLQLVAIASPLVRSLRSSTEALRADVAAVAGKLGDQHELALSLSRRAAGFSELVSELDRIVHAPTSEQSSALDLAALLHQVAGAADSRAARHGVTLRVDAPTEAPYMGCRGLLSLLLRALTDQAIAATGMGGEILLSLRPLSIGLELAIEDGGPVVPESAQGPLVRGVGDPSSLGRPGGLSWVLAGSVAQALGLRLELGQSMHHRCETRCMLGGDS